MTAAQSLLSCMSRVYFDLTIRWSHFPESSGLRYLLRYIFFLPKNQTSNRIRLDVPGEQDSENAGTTTSYPCQWDFRSRYSPRDNSIGYGLVWVFLSPDHCQDNRRVHKIRTHCCSMGVHCYCSRHNSHVRTIPFVMRQWTNIVVLGCLLLRH